MATKTQNKVQHDNAKLVNITNAVGDSEILLYGYVGKYENIDWEPFQSAFRQMEAQVGSGNITLRINCFGGDTIRGLSIYDLIRNSQANIITINEGVAASMGALLFLAGDERVAMPNSRTMIHAVSGRCEGEAQDLRNFADEIDAENTKLITILMDRTCCDEKTAKSWCMYGKDTWFDVKKATECKLIHRVETSKKAQLDNSIDFKNEQTIKNYFSNVLNNNISKPYPMKNLLVLLASLNMSAFTNTLKDEATEQQVFDAIKNALGEKDAKITELQNKLQKQVDDQAEALVNSAISDGKIKATEKDAYLADAKTNFDLVNRMLGNIPAKANLASNVDRSNSGEQKEGDKKNALRESWTFRDYETKDKAALENMQKNEPVKFNKLFKEFYGVDYEA